MITEIASPDPALLVEGRPVHPLLHAGKWLLADLFSTLTFVGLYAATHNALLATAPNAPCPNTGTREPGITIDRGASAG